MWVSRPLYERIENPRIELVNFGGGWHVMVSTAFIYSPEPATMMSVGSILRQLSEDVLGGDYVAAVGRN